MLEKIYQFKAKDSEIIYYSLCLHKISKDFTISNIKKAELKRNVQFFSVDFNPIDTDDILSIHKYLLWIIQRLGVMKLYDEERNLNEKKTTCKMQNFYILLKFLLITIVLLIAVSIYCYLIKY